jgi:acetylornithine deacetylase/succinyl-diaminopimelate desuccinylase-like protein
MKLASTLVVLAATLASQAFAQAPATTLRADQLAFRELYKELVEINTTLSVGSCTQASEAMAARLTAAGYSSADVKVMVPEGRPKDGALIATLAGADRKLKPVLLLAHLDVVEARREDWERDPFKLVEEDGWFYARGASDDKAMAAIFVDSLIRYRQEGFKPRRTIKIALTCGEETADTFNGVDYLLKNHPGVLDDAAFVINEGGGGRMDAQGRRIGNFIQVGEKVYQDYTLEIRNPGGHSSRPLKDNAIVRLSKALARIGDYDFPLELNPVTKANFAATADIVGGEVGVAMKAMTAGETIDLAAAEKVAASDPSYNATLRTTCVPTQVDAGHAPNALPQRAVANVNCRILPGHDPHKIRDELQRIAADEGVVVRLKADPTPVSVPPPLTPQVLGPARQVTEKMWPGTPLIPSMLTGATDGRFLNAKGVPTYGLSGIFGGPGGNGAHGLNERIGVTALYEGRDFLHEVVRLYASQR